MKHRCAELLHAIADGKQIQYLNEVTNVWETGVFNPDYILYRIANVERDVSHYRVKPPYILINGIEVPEPCREPLSKGDRYWIPGLMRLTGLTYANTWSGIPSDLEYLNRGFIHLTEGAAETHAKALLSFTSSAKD